MYGSITSDVKKYQYNTGCANKGVDLCIVAATGKRTVVANLTTLKILFTVYLFFANQHGMPSACVRFMLLPTAGRR